MSEYRDAGNYEVRQMSENYSNEIREEIIKKALLIFNTAFSEDTANGLEESKTYKEQLKESVFFENFNQEKASEALYTLYIEELLSQGKLGEFIKKLCEDHQSDQTLQDAKEELINLLENLDTAESERRNLEPPSVPAKHTTESIYDDALQQDKTSPSNYRDREIPNTSNETEPQFTFNRCLEALKQFIRTLSDETEQPRLTAKQLIGFIVMVLGAILVTIGFGVDKRS